ncbi:hypothetical protein [Streptomonospora wellingtoniae]|uniref:Uncharacterized protein n=1 Tax=Streptomonospora wellingtoniae TaxID=3075544 RepID=A0ABU2KRL1_9ACTN|nr:hypothetical protein [Streptomonospora sp. DSM 45055]MDT0301856.1 hypothetical protein [Streptomonospora sp. DSM 45055]
MPRTGRSRRGARVAAEVRAARVASGLWPSARRWLVVAGLLSGAWLAGAACAAADESPVAGLAGSAASKQASQQGESAVEAVQDLDPAASDRAADVDSGSSDAGAGEEAASDGGGTQEVADGVDTLPSASVGDAEGASGSDASSDSDPGTRADRSGPQSGSGDAAQSGSATGRLTGAVAGVGEVGRDAGHTVPASVAATSGSGPTAAVSAAAAGDAAAAPHGLPGIGVADLRPAGFDKAGVIPGLGLGGSSGPGAGSAAERTPDSGPRLAADGTGPAPADQGSVPAGTGSAATVADYADAAVYGGSAADDGSEQHDGGADHRSELAAAVGSSVNTSQPGGGMCAGYLPAADSAVPAAGAIQRARQALADVPQDLGEQPTFSPD